VDIVGAVVTIGGVLMVADAVKGTMLYRLHNRVLALEGSVSDSEIALQVARQASEACAQNARAIDGLAAVVKDQGDELVKSREIANENQTAILTAMKVNSEETIKQIKGSFISRDVLQAQIQDLYNRTAPPNEGT